MNALEHILIGLILLGLNSKQITKGYSQNHSCKTAQLLLKGNRVLVK